MNSYIKNPKTAGSGIICCIPQKGKCPNDCDECYFNSGRSYLEPLDEHTPNMPTIRQAKHRIVRVNDGNDSHNDMAMVMKAVEKYPLKFYNTCSMRDLEKYDAPVVFTINPGSWTDKCPDSLIYNTPVASNLMFIRVRTNTWNIDLVELVVAHFTKIGVPVVLTFMAYHELESIPEHYKGDYIYRKRTVNSYYAIRTCNWAWLMDEYRFNKLVYSCGKIEGEIGTTLCRYCGNCLREFYATMERMGR